MRGSRTEPWELQHLEVEDEDSTKERIWYLGILRYPIFMARLWGYNRVLLYGLIESIRLYSDHWLFPLIYNMEKIQEMQFSVKESFNHQYLQTDVF